jgi:UDP-N-acetylmuramate dehydrogenase
VNPITENAPLAPLTTLRIGGAAKRLWTVDSEDGCVEAIKQLDHEGEQFFVLGGGSNVVISDQGFDGTALHLIYEGAEHQQREDQTFAIDASAGDDWALLVDALVEAGLSGVECLAGIPGSVGATPIQNVGAYGQEVATTIEAVRVFNRATRQVEELSAAQCGFSYRNSALKGNPELVVLAVRFLLERSRLASGPRPRPRAAPCLSCADRRGCCSTRATMTLGAPVRSSRTRFSARTTSSNWSNAFGSTVQAARRHRGSRLQAEHLRAPQRG